MDRDTMALLDQSSRPPFSKAEGEGSRESSPRTVPSMSKNESKKQIFLSYSGKDRSFVEQLYEDLRNEGYRLFFDCAAESLPIGARFSELIFQSARECDIAVVVLSEEYLLSKWPMLELATFFNAQKLDNKIILPLFYRIEVSALKDVETQRRLLHTWETYAKEDARIDPMEWLDAVRALLNINGLVFNKVSEVAYRTGIVRSIYNLCSPDVEFDLEGEGSGESPPRIVPSMSKNKSKKKIFVSHSNKDRSFVEQLNEDLRNKGYQPIGARFSELILQSAREYDIAVVVLSEEYLLSKRRMLELVTCLNAQKLDNKKKILPLFYRIVVSALKAVETQRRLFYKWKIYANGDSRIDPNEWLDAVRALVRINGLVFDEVSEVAYRKEIVRSIYNFCPPDVEFDLTDMVGVERLCQLVAGKLDQKRKDGRAAILGFYGMGGLGKTTLCKALCNHFQQDFNGRVYYLDFGSGDALAILEEALRLLTNPRSDLILDGLKNEVQVDHMLIRLMEVLPLQDVFVAIDNLPSKMDLRISRLVRILLQYLNKDSMCIVTSRSAETLEMLLPYLGTANIMPCPSLTESEATNVFGYSLQGVHNQDPLEWKRQNAIPKKMADDGRTRIFAIIGKMYSTLNDPDKLLFRNVAEFALDSEKLLGRYILLKQLPVALNTNERDIRQRLEKFEFLSILKVGSSILKVGELHIGMHDWFIDFVHYALEGEELGEGRGGGVHDLFIDFVHDAWEGEGLSGGGGGSSLRIKPAMRSESEEPQPEIDELKSKIEHAKASLDKSGPLPPATRSEIVPKKSGPLPPATRSEIVPKKSGPLPPATRSKIVPKKSGPLPPATRSEIVPKKSGPLPPATRSEIVPKIITVILSTMFVHATLSNLLYYYSFGEVSLPLLVASGFILGIIIDYSYIVLVWYTPVIWTLALLGTLWISDIPIKDILTETSMEILMLIHSFGLCIGSYIPFIGFIFFVVTWSISIYAPSGHKVKVVWKYNFWRFLGMIFKSNNSQLLKFADFVRKIFPHFAPCNAFQDDVSCSTKTSWFITSTHGGGILGLVNSYPIVALDHYSKETFSNQGFQIGAGSVHITKLSEDQFHFQCEVRREVLEDIVAITNWERIAIVLSILQFWQTSPKVGVIENLIHGEGAIYCHALSIKEILQGVHKSLDYFSIFQLQEPKQFFVGCGGGAVSMSHDKANGGREASTIVAVMGAVGVYYQLRDSYSDVAVISLVVLSVLAILIFVLDFFGHLFKKSCFYGITTILCCGSTRGRLGIYRWLKKRNSSLPYCDEFKPDQLQLDDHSKEAIILSELDYVRRRNVAVAQTPNWGELDINVAASNPCNWGELELDRDVRWLNRRLGGMDVYFQLYIDSSNQNVVFQMVKERRTVLVRSEYHDLEAKSLNDTMTTEVSVDEHARLYKWTAGSFYLFVYLMLKWQATDLGVIERFEHFMLRTYYHVFSPHGLASHIRDHNLHSYYLLPRD